MKAACSAKPLPPNVTVVEQGVVPLTYWMQKYCPDIELSLVDDYAKCLVEWQNIHTNSRLKKLVFNDNRLLLRQLGMDENDVIDISEACYLPEDAMEPVKRDQELTQLWHGAKYLFTMSALINITR